MIKYETKYKIFSRQARANPHPIYERMRVEDPIYCEAGPTTGNTFWFLTRYEDCVTALKDPRIGKEIYKHVPAEMQHKFPVPPPIHRHMLNMDPPDHTRLRGFVSKSFTPRIVENLRPRMQELADRVLDQLQDRHEMDLIADYAVPFPITLLAELLGIPSADREQFRAWTHKLIHAQDKQKIVSVIMEFREYMSAVIEERRKNPKQDLLSGLLAVSEREDRLSLEEVLNLILLLLVAGHETTVNLIGNGMLTLLQHPDQMEKLRNHPDLIGSAVEELLRFNGPIEVPPRYALEDVEIGGITISQGDMVFPVLLAANRDPQVFPNPNRLDITRDPNKHIAFGNGIHFCLGAPLARVEAAIAINTLLARLPDLHITPDDFDNIQWMDTILVHGVKALPVKF